MADLHLIVETREGTRDYVVPEGPSLIGRKETCDLTIADSSVSKEHARIHRYDDHLEMVDLDSSNGCYLNGERVTGTVTLLPGDELMLGSVRATVKGGDVAGADEEEEERFLFSATAGPQRGEEFVVDPAVPASLGAHRKNDIALKGDGVSRYHSEVFFEEGCWFIKDLGSRNGTYVNRERVEERRLLPGDEVQIGEIRLEFRLDKPGQSSPLRLVGAIAIAGILLLFLLNLSRGSGTAVPDEPGLPEYQSKMRAATYRLLDRKYSRAVDLLMEAKGIFPEAKLPPRLTDLGRMWQKRNLIFAFKWNEAQQLLDEAIYILEETGKKARNEEEAPQTGEAGEANGGTSDGGDEPDEKDGPEEEEGETEVVETDREAIESGTLEPDFDLSKEPPLASSDKARLLDLLRGEKLTVDSEVRAANDFDLAQSLAGQAQRLEEEGDLTEARRKYEAALEIFEDIPVSSVFRDSAEKFAKNLAVNLQAILEDEGDAHLHPLAWKKDPKTKKLTLEVLPGRSLGRQRPKWRKALTVYDKAVSLLFRRGDVSKLREKVRIAKLNMRAEAAYEQGYRALRDGRYEKAREWLQAVDEESLWFGDADALLVWIDNQLKYKAAKKAYDNGQGEQALSYLDEILDGLLDEGNRKEVLRRKEMIEKAMVNLEKGEKAYKREDHAEAIRRLQRVLALEKDEENYYRKRAKAILEIARGTVQGEMEVVYSRGMDAYEAENYKHARENFLEVWAFGPRNPFALKISRRLAKDAKALYNEAFDILLRYNKREFPRAKRIFQLLIDFLPDGNQYKKMAQEKIKRVK